MVKKQRSHRWKFSYDPAFWRHLHSILSFHFEIPSWWGLGWESLVSLLAVHGTMASDWSPSAEKKVVSRQRIWLNSSVGTRGQDTDTNSFLAIYHILLLFQKLVHNFTVGFSFYRSHIIRSFAHPLIFTLTNWPSLDGRGRRNKDWPVNVGRIRPRLDSWIWWGLRCKMSPGSKHPEKPQNLASTRRQTRGTRCQPASGSECRARGWIWLFS